MITKKEADKVLEWCKKNIGKSKYHNINTLHTRINNKLHNFLGLYYVNKNRIYVNPSKHKTKINGIATIIHEYVHFTQDPEEYDYYLDIMPRSSKYYDHPHEKEAERIANKLKYKCKKELGL